MNLQTDELDEWAIRAQRTNGALLHASMILSKPDLTPEALHAVLCWIQDAQEQNAKLNCALHRQGADPNRLERPASSPKPLTLELLTSPANRRLLDALRQARDAAEAVDRERGYWPDGFAETLGDYVLATELEINGPPLTNGKE